MRVESNTYDSNSELSNNGQNGEKVLKKKSNFSLSCEQCILQWTYTAGNNWGMCDNGTGDLGCGPQVKLLFLSQKPSSDAKLLLKTTRTVHVS